MHEISVIISNFNGARWIPRLMDTLRGQRGVNLEVIVVDRNSTDGSHETLARYPEVQVVSHPPETGLVSGYAFGAQRATKNMFFFMNEDMWLQPDCLCRVADAANVAERIGAVMPLQRTYDLSGLVNCGVWFEDARWAPATPYPFRAARVTVPSEIVKSAQINAGACLVHRRVYEDVGGWDTQFFLDYEDTDLSLRLWQMGWYCAVVPDAIIGHAVGASNAQTLGATQTTVFKKRYVDGGSNVIAIAIKTFSPHLMWLPLLGWMERILRNLLHGRLERVGWDLEQLNVIRKRLPLLLAYRRSNHDLNKARPGERYFRSQEFEFSSLASRQKN